MKILTSCKNSSRIDPEPSPRMKNGQGVWIWAQNSLGNNGELKIIEIVPGHRVHMTNAPGSHERISPGRYFEYLETSGRDPAPRSQGEPEGMTRRASASESNILGRRQTRWVLARHQKNETRKNHQILIDFSFVSHILYNRINWSEVETCTLKYAWPHIPSSGQTNVQILRNSTFKVELGWYFWWKNSFIMKIQDVAKIWGSGDPKPSPGRKFRRESGPGSE